MKRLNLVYGVSLLLFLLGLSACVSEEFREIPEEGIGYLRLELGDISTKLSAEVETKTVQTVFEEVTLPKAEDFTIDIQKDGKSVNGFPKEYRELPDEVIQLRTGSYMVKAYTDIEHKAIATELPLYFIGSTDVEINLNREIEAKVSPHWGYSAVYPIVEEGLDVHFSSYHLEVSVGNKTEKIEKDEETQLFAPFYLLAGDETSVCLKGMNSIGNEVSIPLFSDKKLAFAKEYHLNVSKDIPEFSFQLQMEAAHTKDEAGYLNGTSVSLAFGDLSKVPTGLITEWSAELQNSANEVVRTYSVEKPVSGSEVVMDESTDWPYLPQGSYTLKYKYTLAGEEVVAEQTETVDVPAPEFEVSFEPYTSYTKYLANEIEAANNCENNKIYNIKASVNIANELLAMEKYSGSFSYTYEGVSELISENSFEKEDLSVSEWKQYEMVASATFDGVTKDVKPEVHITGLPYVPNGMVETDWSLASWNCKFEDGAIQLGGIAGSGECSATSTMAFHIPNNTEVRLDANVTVRDYKLVLLWYTTEFTVAVNGSSIISQPGNKQDNNNTGKNYDLQGNAVFMPGSNSIKLNSSYEAAGPWSKIYKLYILYR